MAELSKEDKELIEKLLRNPLLIPESFRGWLQQFATGAALPHIQELAGYRARRWKIADAVPTFETATSVGIGSSTLQDIATVGPQLTGLPKGRYASMWGYHTQGGTGISRFSMLKYNAGTANEALSGFANATIQGNSVGFDIETLTREVNTIKQQYAIVTDNRTGDFGLRWLATIRLEDS